MITSSHNPKLQWVRLLESQAQARNEAQAFIVEGVRLAEEALAAGWEAQLVFYSEEVSPRGQSVVEGFARRGAPVEQVAPQILKSVADTETPQGLLLVLSMRALPQPEKADFLLILDGVCDPGNLGTILRSARAAGVQSVLLPPGTVDPFLPKVVRAGMGAHFHLPILRASWDELNQTLIPGVEAGLRIYLADSGGGQVYTHANFSSSLALIVGGEAQGAGDEALRLAHEKVHIPMPGGSESLNAAVAAGILLFEVLRQRQSKDLL
jgi:TrmH family RNA methyltransferase